MQPPVASFQHSYNRAAAAVMLWCVAFILPILIASASSPTIENLFGLAFSLAFTGYGVVQLIGAIKKRQWSDIVVFGVVPVMLFAASLIFIV